MESKTHLGPQMTRKELLWSSCLTFLLQAIGKIKSPRVTENCYHLSAGPMVTLDDRADSQLARAL
jgi:hypothetical protein